MFRCFTYEGKVVKILRNKKSCKSGKSGTFFLPPSRSPLQIQNNIEKRTLCSAVLLMKENWSKFLETRKAIKAEKAVPLFHPLPDLPFRSRIT